jgi:hypothetical protein
MRKRSKYKPKGVRFDVMTYIKQGMQRMASHPAALDLRIKNHQALTSIVRGTGTRDDVDVLINAFNVTEALAKKIELGDQYAIEIQGGQDALFTMARRCVDKNRFIFTGPEMQAVNLAMEIHDAQLDEVSVADLERALEYVVEQIRNKRARVVMLETQAK